MATKAFKKLPRRAQRAAFANMDADGKAGKFLLDYKSGKFGKYQMSTGDKRSALVQMMTSQKRRRK